LVGLVEGTTKCNEYEMTGAPCWPIIMIGLGDLLLVVSRIYLVSEFYGWGQSFFFFSFFGKKPEKYDHKLAESVS
jgi:hypothetical protein